MSAQYIYEAHESTETLQIITDITFAGFTQA
jgi:hypothetical protein